MLYGIWMYQQINGPIILTIFIVLQRYESLNFRHMSNYIILWPLMTLTFTQWPWTNSHVVANHISFNLSTHMMPYIDSSWCYINFHFPNPYLFKRFCVGAVLTKLQISPLLPGLRMSTLAKNVSQVVLYENQVRDFVALLWMQTLLGHWTMKDCRKDREVVDSK